jgi:hypothetical protein
VSGQSGEYLNLPSRIELERHQEKEGGSSSVATRSGRSIPELETLSIGRPRNKNKHIGRLECMWRPSLPPPPRDTVDQVQHSWVPKSQRWNPFGACADLDPIEELEHRSSAVTGSGDAAPARVLAMSNAQ